MATGIDGYLRSTIGGSPSWLDKAPSFIKAVWNHESLGIKPQSTLYTWHSSHSPSTLHTIYILYIYIYMYLCISIFLSIYLSVCLSVCLSVYLSIYLSVYYYHYYYSYSDAYSDSDSSTPLLLPPVFPRYYLVVPVANYSVTVVYSYSSQDAHSTDRLVLIWYAFHWWFKHALVTQAASDLRLCLRLFFSQASTQHARQPPLGQSLSPLSFPCSGLLSRQRLIHSTWRYFAGAVLIWYTASRLLQHVTANLATQAASVLRLCRRLPFLFFFL